MNTKKDLPQLSNSLTAEITTLYHKQSLELINLALMHNKLSIESANKRANDLIKVKDINSVHELVSTHMVDQFKEYVKFAVEAYELGFQANAEASTILHKHGEVACNLTNELVNSQNVTANPLSTIAMSVVKSVMDTSQSMLSNVKNITEKTASTVAYKSAGLAK